MENNNQAESEITDDMISPLIEKKETIVATGYAVVSVQNHDTASQQRLLAIRASKLEAYRSLVDKSMDNTLMQAPQLLIWL